MKGQFRPQCPTSHFFGQSAEVEWKQKCVFSRLQAHPKSFMENSRCSQPNPKQYNAEGGVLCRFARTAHENWSLSLGCALLFVCLPAPTTAAVLSLFPQCEKPCRESLLLSFRLRSLCHRKGAHVSNWRPCLNGAILNENNCNSSCPKDDTTLIISYFHALIKKFYCLVVKRRLLVIIKFNVDSLITFMAFILRTQNNEQRIQSFPFALETNDYYWLHLTYFLKFGNCTIFILHAFVELF